VHTPAPGDLFVTGIDPEAVKSGFGSEFPNSFEVNHRDLPHDACQLIERNSKTGRPNYLAAAHLEMSFCTILSIRDPFRKFHHLAAIYWDVRWEATFQPQWPDASQASDQTLPAFQVLVIRQGTRAGCGPVIMGSPSDPRVTRLTELAQRSQSSKSCNTVAEEATENPQNRRERAVRATFDVGR